MGPVAWEWAPTLGAPWNFSLMEIHCCCCCCLKLGDEGRVRDRCGIIAISHDTVSYDLSQPGFLLEFCDFKSRGVGWFLLTLRKTLTKKIVVFHLGWLTLLLYNNPYEPRAATQLFGWGSRCSMFCDSSGFFEDIGTVISPGNVSDIGVPPSKNYAGKNGGNLPVSLPGLKLLRLAVMGSKPRVNLPPNVSAWICFLPLDERIFT